MDIKNRKEFFQNIFLDENGNLVIVLDSKTNPTEKGISQYNTYKKLTLTPEGFLKVYTD